MGFFFNYQILGKVKVLDNFSNTYIGIYVPIKELL